MLLLSLPFHLHFISYLDIRWRKVRNNIRRYLMLWNRKARAVCFLKQRDHEMIILSKYLDIGVANVSENTLSVEPVLNLISHFVLLRRHYSKRSGYLLMDNDEFFWFITSIRKTALNVPTNFNGHRFLTSFQSFVLFITSVSGRETVLKLLFEQLSATAISSNTYVLNSDCAKLFQPNDFSRNFFY